MAKLPHKRLSIQTVGCRLNQYESERMVAELYPFGFRRVSRHEPADLYIINTCTVTHRADSDNRYHISRAARQNPSARIVVAGCYVDKDPEHVAGMAGVDVILSNKEKSQLTTILPQLLPDLFADEPDKGCSAEVVQFENYNRAWLKISDGCNQWCSFCILPTVRGRLSNRPVADILHEARVLVEQGFCEIALTGVHLGHYKNRKVEPQAKNLAHLCRMLLEETDLPRIRLSSIEPQTVRDDLIELYGQAGDRICRHLHMPLQSGSSRILKAMQRPYDQNTYLRRVEAVRAVRPDTIIGADVIVGFPGETDEDFSRTRRLVESGLLDYLHVFSYSDRPGTLATGLPDKVDPEVIKERNAILSRLSNKCKAAAHARQVGQVLPVISENKPKNGGDFFGVADNYLRVKLPAEFAGGRQIVRVRITQAHDTYVEGELLSS